MDAVEICQDGIPIPGHAAETTLCEMHDTMDVKVHPNMEKKKKKKRKASEAGGRNFTGKVCVLLQWQWAQARWLLARVALYRDVKF